VEENVLSESDSFPAGSTIHYYQIRHQSNNEIIMVLLRISITNLERVCSIFR